jgi:glyoxylase-like metal-dependent hydrolase (beta-lactamase superfamily II)/rhodanese-related sulfurtransferase
VIFEQFYLNCLAHASYLVGDERSSAAAVVDPQRDIAQYLALAHRHHLRIDHVILTHFHADFIAGHLELRDRTGAAIYLGARARAEYAFTPLADGERIELGDVRLQALETPGHTPESISILVYDLAAGTGPPHAVLTGDTLFVGDVGRPDLRVALGSSAADLGGMLYQSLQTKLLTLPDDTLVYPAHGAGSLCGKAIRNATVSTIGEERRTNYALQPMTRAAFIRLVTADQPDAPPYFTYDAVLNTRERPTLDEALARDLKPLTLERVLARQAEGAQVLDVRDPLDFAAAHLAGSLNVGLGGPFATWAGTVLSPDRPTVMIADPGREHEAATRLGRIGLDRIDGYLGDGMLSVDRRPELTRATERLSAQLAARRLASDDPPLLIDVRAPGEHDAKRIAGSVNIPLNHLVERLGDLPPGRPVLLYCAGGYRSSIGASVVQQRRIGDVSEIAGGLAAWEAAGLPLETGLEPNEQPKPEPEPEPEPEREPNVEPDRT